MALLLALGLSVLALAVLPGTARPGLLVPAAAIETALVLGAVTGDTVLTLGGAIAATLAAILIHEVVRSVAARIVPGRDAVRVRALERRTLERRIADDERLRRRAERELRRAQGDERAAA
jgi:hypothetical protein